MRLEDLVGWTRIHINDLMFQSVGKVYQGTFSGSDEIGENLHSPPNREEGEKDCCLCIRYIPI